MRFFIKYIAFSITLLLVFNFASNAQEAPQDFSHNLSEVKKPWTNKPFYNDPENFQFVVVSDRTGGHRKGVFGKAVEKINQLYPEFVMSVGDLIEGYTKDTSLLNEQWDEFHGILDSLDYRFFYAAGNHDYSNSVMADQWKERYGRDYYHFTYKDVLFLVLNTNDGDGVVIGEDQIAYMKKALEENSDVRWTLIFMHHPIWAYRKISGFDKIESALEGRDFTVYAGHTHRYFHEIRNEQNYYVLATTGGGSRLRGPKFGEYDHVSWITMTNEGPKMINLSLSGMVDHDVSNPESRTKARHLVTATNFSTLVMEKEGSQEKKVVLLFKNSSDEPIYFKGRFFHHHHVKPDSIKLNFSLEPKSEKQIAFIVKPQTNISDSPWDPLELDWQMSYTSPFMEPAFQLRGTERIELEANDTGIELTKRPIFLEDHKVSAKHPFTGLDLKYELDDNSLSGSSSVFEGPLSIKQSTKFKLALFDAYGFQSKTVEKNYDKVNPAPSVKARKLVNGLQYRYYEGNFLNIPDFSKLNPIKSGVVMEFNPEAISQRLDHFAIQYEGYIEIEESGIYTFYSYSDDGSKVYLDDKLVVDNDGSHSARLREGMIALKKGLHKIRVDYFEDFLGEELRLSFEGPGFLRTEVPFEKLFHRP